MNNITKKISAICIALCMAVIFAIPAFAASTPCNLSIDGYKQREVLGYSMSVDKDTSAGTTEMGVLTIKLPVLNDGTPDMFSYIAENNLKKNGSITVNDTKTGKVAKTINFSDASCVNYEEKYDSKLGYYEEVQLYCAKIKIGNYEYSRPANSTYSPKSESKNEMTGSIFTAGNIALICGAAVVLVAAGFAIGIVVKKKKSA